MTDRDWPTTVKALALGERPGDGRHEPGYVKMLSILQEKSLPYWVTFEVAEWEGVSLCSPDSWLVLVGEGPEDGSNVTKAQLWSWMETFHDAGVPPLHLVMHRQGDKCITIFGLAVVR